MEILYVVERAPSGDVLRTYEGMTHEAAAAMIAEGGNTFEFVTEDDFNALAATALSTSNAEFVLQDTARATLGSESADQVGGADDTASRLDALEARIAAVEARIGT